VLSAYKNEIELQTSAIPFILSRMNIEVSKVVLENGITLSPEQSELFKELSGLSNIRYGY
jgi:hypothetical protein